MARLTRSSTDRVIGGVCGGVAEHFDWDPTIVRVVAILAALFGSTGVWLYAIAWALIPATDGSSGVRYAREKLDEKWEQSRQKNSSQDFDPYED